MVLWVTSGSPAFHPGSAQADSFAMSCLGTKPGADSLTLLILEVQNMCCQAWKVLCCWYAVRLQMCLCCLIYLYMYSLCCCCPSSKACYIQLCNCTRLGVFIFSSASCQPAGWFNFVVRESIKYIGMISNRSRHHAPSHGEHRMPSQAIQFCCTWEDLQHLFGQYEPSRSCIDDQPWDKAQCCLLYSSIFFILLLWLVEKTHKQ